MQEDAEKTKEQLIAEMQELCARLAGMQEGTEKTRERLIAEMQELCARIGDIEKSAGKAKKPVSARSQRSELQTEIQFIGDFGLLSAQGIDLSEGGIGFEVDEEIPFEMEFELDGKAHQHRAQLVWMQRLENGHCRFGFEFLPTEPSNLLWLYREIKLEDDDEELS